LVKPLVSLRLHDLNLQHFREFWGQPINVPSTPDRFRRRRHRTRRRCLTQRLSRQPSSAVLRSQHHRSQPPGAGAM